MLNPATQIGSLFRQHHVLFLDNTVPYPEDMVPFPVSPGQATVLIVWTMPGTSAKIIRPVPDNEKPLAASGTLQIGADTVTYNGITTGYGTLDGEEYSALTGCTVTGPQNPVPARTMILNSAALATHLDRIAAHQPSNLWGFSAKDDFYNGDQQLAALQQEYAQIKAVFPTYPVVAGCGGTNAQAIAASLGPGMADLLLIYLYPFKQNTQESVDLGIFQQQLAAILGALHQDGPALPWMGGVQAFADLEDRAVPTPDEALQQVRYYLAQGASGVFSYAMEVGSQALSEDNTPQLLTDAVYADNLAAQTVTPAASRPR